jgi:hypothetical protein
MLANEVERALATASWNGVAATTDLAVLRFLIEVTRQSCKTEVGAAVRTVAEKARVAISTVSCSLRRLVAAGWVTRVTRAKGGSAAIWHIRVPKTWADRTQTLPSDREACDRLYVFDPRGPKGSRADVCRPVPSFDHDLFRWRGLGKSKGRIYALLAVPLRTSQIASALHYRDAGNARVHLRVLVKKELVKRGADGCYARTDADLDALAAQLGVKGSSDRQKARHRVERESWRRWSQAFEHWRRTGQIIDPETGEMLESQEVPNRNVKMHTFRQRVLVIRATLIANAA